MAGWSAKADHWPAAQKGEFSHRLFRPIEIALFGRFVPGVGLRRHPSSAQNGRRRRTIGLRPKKVSSVTACSGRLKSPSLGASRRVLACADTSLIRQVAGWSAKADHWPAAQKGEFSHRLFRPIEIALFGRFAPGVGLRRHPSDTPSGRMVGEGRPLACGPKR